jgi:hypothetical protein
MERHKKNPHSPIKSTQNRFINKNKVKFSYLLKLPGGILDLLPHSRKKVLQYYHIHVYIPNNFGET